jgi:hypothetical protein
MIYPYGAMTSCEAVKAPVLGLNFNFVEDVYSGKLPDVLVFQTGYITAFVVVSSVVPVFVAFVSLVAVVAVVALPDKAPTKVVEVTEVSPAMVVAVPPREIVVDPIVTLELTNAPLGMLVRLAPDPLNPVAVKSPVDGLNWYLVEETYSVANVPDEAAANNG